MKTFHKYLSGFALCASVFALVGCPQKQARADDPKPAQQVFIVPYTPLKGWQVPLVGTRLDKKLLCTFLVDTGSNNDIMTDKVAQQLGLVPKPAVRDGKPFKLNGKQAQYVIPASNEIGPLRLLHPLFLVIDQKQFLAPLDLSAPVQGLISGNNLSEFSVLFDCPVHQIKLWYPGSLPDADIRAAGFDPSQSIPLTIEQDDVLCYLNARFQNGKESGEEKMLVDTGADYTVISSALAQRLKLKPDKEEIDSQVLSGPLRLRRAIVPILTIGGITAKNVEVVYASDTSGGPNEPKGKSAVKLGMHFLSQYRFLIDYGSKRLFLAAAKP